MWFSPSRDERGGLTLPRPPVLAKRMDEFRLCFLTANDHLADTIALSATTLEAAIARALDLADGRRMELWQGGERLMAWAAAVAG